MLLGRCTVPLENMMAGSVHAQRAEMTEAIRGTCLQAHLVIRSPTIRQHQR